MNYTKEDLRRDALKTIADVIAAELDRNGLPWTAMHANMARALADALAGRLLPADVRPVDEVLWAEAERLRAEYRTGDKSIEYINGFEDAAAYAERVGEVDRG
jgi:hypothetical protein